MAWGLTLIGRHVPPASMHEVGVSRSPSSGLVSKDAVAASSADALSLGTPARAETGVPHGFMVATTSIPPTIDSMGHFNETAGFVEQRCRRTAVSASSRKQRYLLRVFGDYDSSMKSSGWRSLTKRIFLPVESKFSFVDMGGIFPDDRGNAVPAMAHFV